MTWLSNRAPAAPRPLMEFFSKLLGRNPPAPSRYRICLVSAAAGFAIGAYVGTSLYQMGRREDAIDAIAALDESLAKRMEEEVEGMGKEEKKEWRRREEKRIVCREQRREEMRAMREEDDQERRYLTLIETAGAAAFSLLLGLMYDGKVRANRQGCW